MNKNPVVTVICLCYNHHKFIEKAIASVYQQSYPNIEIIIVDDGSKDNSQELIKKYENYDGNTEIVLLPENIGNCAAFNRGFAQARGKYIVDLATDDVMLPDRIEKQVTLFEKLGKKVGVVFSNSEYIDARGHHLKWHYPVDKHKKAKQMVPQGDIFANLLANYFISPPSMMIRKEVLDKLGGYDENLAYEDFDFWIRSSRHYQYVYQDLVLTKVRKVKNSLSSGCYIPGDPQLHSTYLVCKKAQELIRDEQEKNALLKRIRYEIRQAVFSENFFEATHFLKLLREMDHLNGFYGFLEWLNNKQFKLSWLRKLYHSIRH